MDKSLPSIRNSPRHTAFDELRHYSFRPKTTKHHRLPSFNHEDTGLRVGISLRPVHKVYSSINVEYCPGYTFPYAAPEIFARYDDHINNRAQSSLELNEKQDVFAFGMIMYELLFNGPAMQIPSDKLKKVYYERQVYSSIMLSYEKAA